MRKNIETANEFVGFIIALQSAIHVGGGRAAIINELFSVASTSDCIGDIETTCENWLKGRNTGYRNYFDSKKFNDDKEKAVLNFFYQYINTKYTKVQNEFKKCPEKYPLIDIETEDMNVFFNSLLNQFKSIVGLPVDFEATKFAKSAIDEVEDKFDMESFKILYDYIGMLKERK